MGRDNVTKGEVVLAEEFGEVVEEDEEASAAATVVDAEAVVEALVEVVVCYLLQNHVTVLTEE